MILFQRDDGSLLNLARAYRFYYWKDVVHLGDPEEARLILYFGSGEEIILTGAEADRCKDALATIQEVQIESNLAFNSVLNRPGGAVQPSEVKVGARGGRLEKDVRLGTRLAKGIADIFKR